MGVGNLHGLEKCSLVDYPGKISAVLFFGGCNLRCPFCHNPALVLDPDSQPQVSFNEYIRFLNGRKGLLDMIVFSGGEPTLCPDLGEWISAAKTRHFDTKLDTNGTRPEIVRKVLDELSHLTLDFKTAPDRMSELGMDFQEKWLETLDLACSAPNIQLEVRTTIHPQIQTAEDLKAMGVLLKERGITHWVWQQFRRIETVAAGFETLPIYTPDNLFDMAEEIHCDELQIKIRGI